MEWSGIAGLWRRGAGVAMDMLLPPHCAACDQPVQQPGQFCARCFALASFITEPCCPSCGIAFAAEGQALCASCATHPPPWRHARAALLYDDFSRRLLLALKNGDATEHADTLGRHMARAGAKLLHGADLLLPVPLHRRRLAQRGYNQAALLARAVSRHSAVPACLDALLRTRHTEKLGHHSARDRAAMLRDAIALRPGRGPAIAGRRVVLIDDVLTTGSTLSACATVLSRHGAASVDVLVAARVARPDVD